MRKIVLLLAACACCLACKPSLLPDPTAAHQLSRDATVYGYVRAPDGTLREQKIKFHAGSFCASPEAMQEPVIK